MGAALANLWIVAEQITSELWSRDVANPTLAEDPRKSRRDQLGDTRTCIASARHSPGDWIGEPEFWMEIPKLPVELELERAEAKFAKLGARKRP